MNFPGMPGGGGGSLGGSSSSTAGMSDQEAAMVKAVSLHACLRRNPIQNADLDGKMQSAMESCPAKSVISGGMGFALGGAFGLFMSSVCCCVCSCVRFRDRLNPKKKKQNLVVADPKTPFFI